MEIFSISCGHDIEEALSQQIPPATMREKDHEPMHVPLVGGDVNVKIDLTSLRIVAGSMPMDLKREVMAWLHAH